MSSENPFTVEYMAISLHAKLDRRNIFPPLFNDPESYVPPNDNYRQKRPPNPFQIYRRNVHHEAKHKGCSNMRVISKVTSIFWNNASIEEKSIYKKLFKRVHEIYYERKNSHLLMPTPLKDSEETPMIYSSFSSPPTFSPPLSITTNNMNPHNFFFDHNQTNQTNQTEDELLIYDTFFFI